MLIVPTCAKKEGNRIIDNMEQLEQELKARIIEALNLEEMTVEQIDSNAPLFGEGLGLDSIDSLELIMMLDKYYGIKLTDKTIAKQVLANVRTLAEYVNEHRTK